MNTQKVALVTGGSRGIGKAICLKLASQDIFTIIHYSSKKEAAEKVLKEIEARGGKGAVVQADFANGNAPQILFKQVDEILRRFPRKSFDILINNAGIGWIQDFERMSPEDFDQLLTINVKTPFFVTQEALSRIQYGGRIINLTSIVTRMAMPAVPAYSMTKASLDTMTLWLAKQLGPRQITVNSVAPGIINTEMNADSLANSESAKAMAAISTFNRVGEPQDIADVVAFLVSDDARWISGQRIEVSGGSYL